MGRAPQLLEAAGGGAWPRSGPVRGLPIPLLARGWGLGGAPGLPEEEARAGRGARAVEGRDPEGGGQSSAGTFTSGRVGRTSTWVSHCSCPLSLLLPEAPCPQAPAPCPQPPDPCPQLPAHSLQPPAPCTQLPAPRCQSPSRVQPLCACPPHHPGGLWGPGGGLKLGLNQAVVSPTLLPASARAHAGGTGL